jgi:hypothetical protein
MFSSERRTTRRHRLRIALRFHRVNALIEDENGATSINVSISGVYFVSSVLLFVGEDIEVSMTVPRTISGGKPSKRQFTGRVKHVNPQGSPAGYSKIGVQFLYYVSEAHAKSVVEKLEKNWNTSRDPRSRLLDRSCFESARF